jgi:hypothetical protein
MSLGHHRTDKSRVTGRGAPIAPAPGGAPFRNRECLRQSGKGPGSDGEDLPQAVPLAEERAADPYIRCRECLHGIARPEDRIEVGDAHSHTFANPAGIVFTIGCFTRAGGCLAAGPSSGEFTWFAGHRWRIGLCRRCACHLGWHFSRGDGGFWGLILDRLRFPSPEEGP